MRVCGDSCVAGTGGPAPVNSTRTSVPHASGAASGPPFRHHAESPAPAQGPAIDGRQPSPVGEGGTYSTVARRSAIAARSLLAGTDALFQAWVNG